MFMTTSFHSQWASSLLWAFTILLLSTQSRGLDISYCSPENNAGSYPEYYNLYQSNGACQLHCQGSYAFAVIQGYYCWCSNYIPSEQESTYNCNQECPGYGSEWCGSTQDDLYAYFSLSDSTPLGTSGGSAASTAASTAHSTSPATASATTTATATATSSPSVSTSSIESGAPTPTPDFRTTASSSSFPAVVTTISSQSSDEASSVTSSSEPSPTSTSPSTASTSSPPSSSSDVTSTLSSPTSSSPTPTEVYTSVTTVTGEVRTVVITPSASADATLGQSSTGGGGGGVSTGKVVGIVLGVALGIGALIGIGVWLWFRRRHQKKQLQGGPDTTFIPRTGQTSPSNNIPSRQVSQLSSSGLLGNKTPRINTSGMPTGNDPRSADSTVSNGVDRRSLATDQRLNPYALYIHDESRLSNVSLQDNQDYSRQLRVANPDP